MDSSSTNIFLSEGVGVLGEKQKVDDESNIDPASNNKTGQHNFKGRHGSLLEIRVTRAGMTAPGCSLKENFDGQYHKL